MVKVVPPNVTLDVRPVIVMVNVEAVQPENTVIHASTHVPTVKHVLGNNQATAVKTVKTDIMATYAATSVLPTANALSTLVQNVKRVITTQPRYVKLSATLNVKLARDKFNVIHVLMDFMEVRVIICALILSVNFVRVAHVPNAWTGIGEPPVIYLVPRDVKMEFVTLTGNVHARLTI